MDKNITSATVRLELSKIKNGKKRMIVAKMWLCIRNKPEFILKDYRSKK